MPSTHVFMYYRWRNDDKTTDWKPVRRSTCPPVDTWRDHVEASAGGRVAQQAWPVQCGQKVSMATSLHCMVETVGTFGQPVESHYRSSKRTIT